MIAAFPELAEPLVRLNKDFIKAGSKLLGLAEIRYLVDSYYTWQKMRIALGNQEKALDRSDEPHEIISYFRAQPAVFEQQIKSVLDRWTSSDEVASRAKEITGIGPVISAGLRAHIDIAKCPVVGHIWRFAGLDPTMKWERSQKRPWNASLKVITWKIGESFVKVSGLESDFYGKVYLARKEAEQPKNETGVYAEQAEAKLKAFNIGKSTEAYKWYSQGKLPPAHIHARAKRYAVKLFLSHYHHVAYYLHFREVPPKPFAIEHGGHAHYIAPPPQWGCLCPSCSHSD